MKTSKIAGRYAEIWSDNFRGRKRWRMSEVDDVQESMTRWEITPLAVALEPSPFLCTRFSQYGEE